MPVTSPKLTSDSGETYPADAAERGLRSLYRQEAGTVRLGMIRSADGLAAGPDGLSRSLNGPGDLRVLRVVRSWADVVVVGGRTARAEGYRDIALPVPLAQARAESGVNADALPDLAIVTATGELPPGVTPQRTWIVTTGAAVSEMALSPEWAARVVIAGETELDAAALVAGLRERGASRIVCEGGPALAERFLDSDAVDDYCLTTSPHAGGDDAPTTPAPPQGWALAHALSGDGFTMERWARP